MTANGTATNKTEATKTAALSPSPSPPRPAMDMIDGIASGATAVFAASTEATTTPTPTMPSGGWTLREEARLLFSIAIPTVAIQLGIFLLFPQTASLVGRTLGTDELAGFSLASLLGNMTCLSVIIGALSASETLQPRAYGAGRYGEVGLLATRGCVACALALLPPVVPLLLWTDSILVRLGQDARASHLASRWVRVYLAGVPSVVLFRTTQRFLACQGIAWPMAGAAAFGCFVAHPWLLRLWVGAFGFVGSGAAVVCTQFVQALSAIAYLACFKPHKAETWPGLTPSFLAAAVRTGPIKHYLKLSLGGVMSFSEWWFWEAVCFLAGRFGVIPLCVHTVAYQLVPVLFMIPLGLSIGLSVRIGTVLATDVYRAKRIAMWTMAFTVSVATLLALILYHFRDPIVRIFTVDEQVMEGCNRIWAKVSVYIIVLYCFGINSGIMRALGLQWRMAAVITSFTWGMALPAMVHFAVRRGGGIDVVWTILPVAYVLMNAALVASYATMDWSVLGKDVAKKEARRRSRDVAVVAVADKGTKEEEEAEEIDGPDEKTYLFDMEGRRHSRSGGTYRGGYGE